jgi:hypothetical protein
MSAYRRAAWIYDEAGQDARTFWRAETESLGFSGDEIEEAIKRTAESSDDPYSKGLAFLYLGAYDQADVYISRSLYFQTLTPLTSKRLVLLARARFEMSQYGESRRLLSNYLKMNPTDELVQNDSQYVDSVAPIERPAPPPASREQPPASSGTMPAHTEVPRAKQEKQNCEKPNYPTLKAAPIDSACDPTVSSGAETAENQVKNNFCAPGSESITIADMIELQKKVESTGTIPFGRDRARPVSRAPGPATDRIPLQKLGEGQGVVLTGYVKSALLGGPETANCGDSRHPNWEPNQVEDIVIKIVASPGDSECSGVVVEMIPYHRPASWTTRYVQAVGQAKLKIRVTGQLMFDSQGMPCANGKAIAETDKSTRTSLWEVHPVYKFEVCPKGDCGSTGWMPLEEWSRLF